MKLSTPDLWNVTAWRHLKLLYSSIIDVLTQHYECQMADVAIGVIIGGIVSILQTVKYQYFSNSSAVVNAARGQRHSVSPPSCN